MLNTLMRVARDQTLDIRTRAEALKIIALIEYQRLTQDN